MKYIKLFEDYKYIDFILNKDIGDIVDESDIYNYVESLHHNYDDFIDGDLAKRIEWYPEYKLVKVDLSKLDLDEFYWDEVDVEEFKDKFLNNKTYPPIVISHDYSIIDGTHRANALYQVGETEILAFMGIGKDEVYDPFF